MRLRRGDFLPIDLVCALDMHAKGEGYGEGVGNERVVQ